MYPFGGLPVTCVQAMVPVHAVFCTVLSGKLIEPSVEKVHKLAVREAFVASIILLSAEILKLSWLVEVVLLKNCRTPVDVN